MSLATSRIPGPTVSDIPDLTENELSIIETGLQGYSSKFLGLDSLISEAVTDM